MKIYNHLLNTVKAKGAAYLILLDPDKLSDSKIIPFVKHCEKSGVDGFLIGGSLLISGDLNSFIETIKVETSLPLIIFPGSVNQISPLADAILFLSVISGRNAEHLIGKHVTASSLIKRANVEPISTGYILVESGVTTTAVYMSGSLPIPKNKPEIAAATALAGEYLGMKLIYLEAGSGAQEAVPDEMVKAVSEECTVPIIVGGGIRNPQTARRKVENGASIIVTGNFFEDENNWDLIKDFSSAIHYKLPVEV
ncbi:MAG: geranylgeranylglyceryl/heptaprenylglyceryl phosphate synthase [Ignavibacteriaceae bacterium]|jgi:putative glycerol-1-phosphate prenyltransferase|nr:geranylgeranylglyceryl/heptaprenylglyceryl phosphate synthase [Ignavibacteriaceae bacterium]MCW8814020.1 geranylgeranylglyceryl/heptaprenylglyceryl phosphate synthase [Chlorobium sp.]MCW8996243.1 geranylgeranylglyceryl/heptaprenylglyceryl phosphate synthase [Psychromonas sp.]MCW8817777.1 geranylgeranylglyceryl/heptaprenylglyceryl phosphate synthase [Ignavibacteriaceae bacterium]MCW8822642.1 geranylgeranylglyceryl/heptaprenylglyceryl phosphate synthase [Ignavibacteriaceae bacterium]